MYNLSLLVLKKLLYWGDKLWSSETLSCLATRARHSRRCPQCVLFFPPVVLGLQLLWDTYRECWALGWLKDPTGAVMGHCWAGLSLDQLNHSCRVSQQSMLTGVNGGELSSPMPVFGSDGKESACNVGDLRSNPRVRKIPTISNKIAWDCINNTCQ